LHWLAPGEPREAPEAGLQAESATNHEGNPRRRILGFRGDGYIEIREGGWVEWYQENDGARGRFRLTFRQARGPETTDAVARVFVNDVEIDGLPPPDVAVNSWGTHTLGATLVNGANRIRVVAPPGSRVLLDELMVENESAATPATKP
jgi:hypothetical protein